MKEDGPRSLSRGTELFRTLLISNLFKDLCPDLMECCRIEFKGDMVVATPDIYQVPLTSDVEFIILASDGLWDYMKRFPFFFPHAIICLFISVSTEMIVIKCFLLMQQRRG